MRRPGLTVCRGNGVRASPAMAAARTPAKLGLVETMRHRFWLPASARSAASRYGHGSGKNASRSTLGTSALVENAHTSRSPPSPRPSALPLQRLPTARSSSWVSTFFKQSRSDPDFEFDFNLRILTAEAAQNLRQPAVGKVFIGSDSNSPGVVDTGKTHACVFIQTEDRSRVTEKSFSSGCELDRSRGAFAGAESAH